MGEIQSVGRVLFRWGKSRFLKLGGERCLDRRCRFENVSIWAGGWMQNPGIRGAFPGLKSSCRGFCLASDVLFISEQLVVVGVLDEM